MSTATAPTRELERSGRLLCACEFALLALVVWHAITTALSLFALALTPFQFDYGEGNVLATLARISHGLTPYPDPRAFPNAIDPYGPIGYYLLAIPTKLFGVSLLAPRLVILASVAAICVFLVLIAARCTRSLATAVIFGALYATLPLVQALGAILRIDLIGIALTTAGLYLFSRAINTETGNRQSAIGNVPWPFYAVVVLFVLAVFTKHSLLAAPGACLLYLVARRRWREAATFAGFSAVLGVLAFGVAEILTRGFFAQHLFLTHPDPFSWNGYALRISRLAVGGAPLVVLAAVRIVSELREKQLSLPSWWFLLATITAITAGKQGSGWNHFLEWMAALCLCAALGWDVVRRSRPAAVVFAAAIVIMLVRPAQPIFDWSNGLQQCSQAYAYVRDHAGDRVLSENVSALLLGGKSVWVLDPFVYSQLVMHGGWRDDVIEPRLRARWFDLVVMRRDYTASPDALQRGVERFSGGMLRALAANYRLTRTFQCTDANAVFEPLPLQSR